MDIIRYYTHAEKARVSRYDNELYLLAADFFEHFAEHIYIFICFVIDAPPPSYRHADAFRLFHVTA